MKSVQILLNKVNPSDQDSINQSFHQKQMRSLGGIKIVNYQSENLMTQLSPKQLTWEDFQHQFERIQETQKLARNKPLENIKEKDILKLPQIYTVRQKKTFTIFRKSKTNLGRKIYRLGNKKSMPYGLKNNPEPTEHDGYSASNSFVSNSEEELDQLYKISKRLQQNDNLKKLQKLSEVRFQIKDITEKIIKYQRNNLLSERD